MLISFTAVWSHKIQIAGDLIGNQKVSFSSLWCVLVNWRWILIDGCCMTREKKEIVMQEERNFLSHAMPRSTRTCSGLPPLSKLHFCLPVWQNIPIDHRTHRPPFSLFPAKLVIPKHEC